MVILTLAVAARADTVRINDQAGAHGDAVKLADIAELTGDYAQQLAATPIATFQNGRRDMTLTLAQVRQALTDRGVNWGRLSLSGFTRCDVTRIAPRPEPTVDHTPAAASNTREDVKLDTALTLRQQVLNTIQRLAGVDAKQLVVTFSDRDAKAVDRSALDARYEIQPTSSTGIGRVPITIRRYDAGGAVQTLLINPQVQRRLKAVVVSDTVSRGRRFTEANTKVTEVLLDTDRGEPVTDPDAVRGQVAASLLRAGEVVYADDVAPPVLVRRGELVSVHAIVGQMVIRTVARAAEDGSRGDKVTLRNEKTHETFTATVTGPREAAVMPAGAPPRK